MLTEKELKSAETFRSLNKALETPGTVYKLNLRGATSIKELPETIKKFKNLQFLDLSQSSVSVLPAWVGEFKNLQTLNIDETPIGEIPVSIIELQNLHTLETAFAYKLQRGIEYIFKLQNLKKLTIPCYIPLTEEIQNLHQLEYLYTSNLDEKSKLEYAFALSSLKELEISGDKFKKTPTGISRLTNLETLTIASTQVFELPEELEQTAIKKLGYNELFLLQWASPKAITNEANYSQIFKVLSTIKTLQKVELINNEIEILDKNIGLLNQIKELNLYINNLDTENSFPKEMTNMTSLKKLKIAPDALSLKVIADLQKALPNLKISS